MILTRRRITAFILCAAILLSTATSVGLTAWIWEYDYSALHDWIHAKRCQSNFRDLRVSLLEYSEDVEGEYYPPLSNQPGTLMFMEEDMAPYLSEYPVNSATAGALICPAPDIPLPEQFYDDGSYVYTGYLLHTDEDVLAFASGYASQIAAGGDFTESMEIETSYGDTLYRLRQGIERFLITDINNPHNWQIMSEIPLIWEWPDNHQAGWGGNVLYQDGHVEWVPYPGKFPMTEVAVSTLAALAGYTPPTAWKENSVVISYPPTASTTAFFSDSFGDLHDLGNGMTQFARANPGGLFPPLSSEPYRLMVAAESVYPAYVLDRDIVNAPGVPQSTPPAFFDDQDYIYLGYLLTNDEDVEHFAEAYAAELASGGDFTQDLDHVSSYGSSLYRLGENVEQRVPPAEHWNERLFAAQVPVVIEWPDNYEGISGGLVLYLDGHVAWQDYPGAFPMTETTITRLRSLAQVPPRSDWLPPSLSPLSGADPYGFAGRCGQDIQRVGAAIRGFGWYTAENEGAYPDLSMEPGRLMFTENQIDYHLRDPRWLICPGAGGDTSPAFFDDQHYVYTGYALLNDDDVESFAAAYVAELDSGGDFSGDLVAPSSYGDTILHLRTDVADAFSAAPGAPLQDIPTAHDVPVLIEWPGNHEGRTGGYVYYLDGEVEWLDYPSKFPMTERTISALGTLAQWTPVSEWPQLNFVKKNDPFQQVACDLNLNLMSDAMFYFSDLDPERVYPRLSCTPNNLMFAEDEAFSSHFKEPRRLNCPGSPQAYHQPAFTDHSYVYLGYAVYDQTSLDNFAAAYHGEIANGGDFSDDLLVDDQVVYRLDGSYPGLFYLESLKPEPAAYGEQDLVLMVEWPDNHGEIRGGNVVYLDGRIRWLDYPSQFPMTEETMEILTELAGREPIRSAAPPRSTTRLDSLLGQ